jgi:hypothetical protein
VLHQGLSKAVETFWKLAVGDQRLHWAARAAAASAMKCAAAQGPAPAAMPALEVRTLSWVGLYVRMRSHLEWFEHEAMLPGAMMCH